MIQSKKDYQFYLAQDKKMLGIDEHKRFPHPLKDEIWKYQIQLRKTEYAVNCVGGVYSMLMRLRLHRWNVKLGFSIPINVFGPGLSIAHYGTIVVHKNARIGSNCRIQEGVNIGATGGEVMLQ